MSKVFKLLVIAIIIFAAVTISSKSNANVNSLSDYITSSHNINGIKVELPDNEKTVISDYIKNYVSDEDAKKSLEIIKEVENKLKAEDINNVENISQETKQYVKEKATEVLNLLGLNGDYNNEDESIKVYDDNETVIAQGGISKYYQSSSEEEENIPIEDVVEEDTETSTSQEEGKKSHKVAIIVTISVLFLAFISVAMVLKERP